MEKQIPHILIVDDDPNLIGSMSDILNAKGYAPHSALTGASALTSIEQFHINVALIDLRLGDASGLDVLRNIKAHSPETECILLTGYATRDSAIDAVQMGAFGYFQKPFDIEQVLLSIQHALEKHEAAQALRRSEEKYRLLVENAGEALYVVQDGRVVFVNPMFEKIAGLPAAEFIGTTLLDFIPGPRDRTAAIKSHLRVLRGRVENAQQEYKVRLRSGTERWIKVNEVRTVWKGEPATLNYATDITERLQVEHQYKVIFDNSLEGIFQSTPNGRFIHVNPAMARIFGYSTPQEMVESVKNIADQIYVNTDERNLFVKLLQENNFIENFEGQNRRNDGGIIWTSTNARRIQDADGNILYFEGFLQDITERKVAEKAVRKNEERYRLLFESAPVGIFSATLDGQIVEINQVALQILGSPSVEATKAINLLTFPLLVETGFSANYKTCIETGHSIFAEQSYTSMWGKSIFVQYRMNPIPDISGQIALIQVVMEDITERKQMNEALRKSEAQYRLLANNISDVIWILDLETSRFTYVSPSVEQLRGYTVAEVLAQDISQTLTSASAEYIQEVIPERIQAAEQGLRGYYLDEVEQPRKDGTTVWTETTTHYTFNAGSGHWEVYGVSRDITERQQAEEALQKSEKRYRGLFEDSPIAIWEEDFSEVKEHLDVLKQQGVKDFRTYFAAHPEVAVECSAKIKVLDVNNAGVQMFSAESKEVLIEQTNSGLSQGELDHNQEDFIAIAEGRSSNHWEGLDEKQGGEPIEISLGWSVVPGYEEDYSKVIVTTLDITERKQADEALQKSEASLQAVLQSTADGILAVGTENEVLYSNERFAELWRIPKAAIAAKDDTILLQHVLDQLSDPQSFLKKVQELYKSEEESFDMLYFKDGRVFERLSHPLLYLAELQGRVWSFRDITERKHAEQALADSEAELRALFTSMQDVVLVIDHEGVYRKIAPTNPGLLVTSPNELLGKNLRDVFPAEQAETFIGVVQQVLQTRQTAHVEYELDINTKHIWFETSISLMDKDSTLWVARDITERKQAEGLLRESEKRYHDLFEDSPIALREEDFSEVKQRLDTLRGQGVTDFHTYLANHPEVVVEYGKLVKINDVNKTALKMYRADHKNNMPNHLIEILGSNALEHFKDQLANIAEGQTHFRWEGIDHTIEGRQMDVEVNWSVAAGYENDLSKVIVSLQDITERKQAEQQRKETLQILQATFSSLNETVLIVDTDTRAIYEFNKTAETMFGYSHEELIGRDTEFLHVNADTFDAFGRKLLAQLKHADHFGFEFQMKRKNGEIFPTEHFGRPLMVEGHFHSVVSVIRDITERKKMETALREREEQYRTLVERLPSIVYIDDVNVEGRTLYISPQIETILGFTPQEWQDKSPDLWSQQVHPDDLERVHADYMRCLQSGEPVDYEYRIRASDGRWLWFRDQATLLRDENDRPHLLQGVVYDITERKQADESIRQRVMELELLYESGLAFIQLLHPNEIAQKIIHLLEQKMDWHHTAIRLYDRETNTLQLLAFNQPGLTTLEEITAVEEHIKGSVTRSTQGLSGWVVNHGQTVRADDLAHDERYFETLPGMLSGLYVPIKLGDHVIGVISIESEQHNAFSDADERLTNTLANQAASALENARLFDETRQRIMELTSLHRAGQTLLSARLNSEQIYAAVHQAVAQTMPCEAFVIVLEDEDRDEYDAVYFFDKGERFPSRRLPREQGLSGRVISTGETVLIHDLNMENLQAIHFGSSDSVRSILAVPLHRGDEIIGMLSVQSYQPHAFGESQRVLLETICAQLSSALDNAQLYQQTQARISELETLHFISTSLRTIQSVNDALSTILDNTLAALKTDAGSILLYDQASNELHDVVARGWFADLAAKSIKIGDGVAGVVFATGKPFYSVELVRDALPHASRRERIPAGWGGVCLPIQTSTEILGVMFVSVQLPRQINAQQIRLLESLMDMAGAALHRMRLHNETGRRAEEFASLYETSKVLSAEYNLDAMLKVIVDRAKAMLNASTSGMYLFDGESQELVLTVDTSPTIPIGSRLRLGEGVAGKVAETRQPLRIDDYSTWEGRSLKYEGIPLHAVIEVPMMYAGELIGVLTADEVSDSSRKFTDADERLLSLFASQAAGAINSARQHAQTVRYAGELELRVRERTAEIEATRQRLDLATNAGGIGVWEVNLKNNKIFWDRQMHAIHGTDPAQFGNLLETWWQIVYAEDRERLQARFIDVVRKKEVFSEEYRIVHSNGSLRYISANASVLYDEDHNPERMIGVNVDITERKHTEAALQLANLEMERAMRTKDEFLANMSHELRTPLNSILGISESLEEQISGPLNAKQLRYIGIVKESGRHLLELINDILDISKIEAGRMELDLQNVPVVKLCQSSLRMVKELAQKKSLKVSFEMINKVDVIFGDERRLKQSLVNLLSNAVKFTPPESHIGLEVCGYPEENEVTFSVWDKGIGISEQNIKLLFQPFVQLDSGLSREYQGTGLGLALVAQMMRLHGGRVGLESQEGEGSRFTITLPWLPEQQNVQVKATAELPGPRPKPEGKRNGRILLVEDTEVIASLLTEYLQYKGYQMLIAHNGMEGILLAKKEYPDLIIMDVMMPVMDGFEATRNIREVNDLKNTPIIALTALAMPGDRERCLAAGMSDYLSKPIRIQELADMIEKHLTNKAGASHDQ